MNHIPFKMFSIFAILVILLIPSAPLLAQEANQPPFDPCDPNVFINDFVTSLSTVQNLDDGIVVLGSAVNTVMQCWSTWLDMVITMVMGMSSSGMMPSLAVPAPPITAQAIPYSSDFDPEDGELTPEEAEYAIQIGFAGDLDGANEFVCPAAQVTPDDQIEGSILNEVSCTSISDEVMSCYIDITLFDVATADTVDFYVVDGKLCEEVDS